jgi:hypothetical protein
MCREQTGGIRLARTVTQRPKASLPDGMNYARQTVLDATAKKFQVTKTNSNYQKRVAY